MPESANPCLLKEKGFGAALQAAFPSYFLDRQKVTKKLAPTVSAAGAPHSIFSVAAELTIDLLFLAE
jgi:hypothetical protein